MEIIHIPLKNLGKNLGKKELHEKNEKFILIENLIQSKRNMLLDKQKKIKIISKQNEYFDEIKNDYLTYYNYIVQQKQEQIDALNLLDSYIKDLSLTGELTDQNIQDSKFEQKRILSEINTIKKGLDNIIKNSNIIDKKIHKN